MSSLNLVTVTTHVTTVVVYTGPPAASTTSIIPPAPSITSTQPAPPPPTSLIQSILPSSPPVISTQPSSTPAVFTTSVEVPASAEAPSDDTWSPGTVGQDTHHGFNTLKAPAGMCQFGRGSDQAQENYWICGRGVANPTATPHHGVNVTQDDVYGGPNGYFQLNILKNCLHGSQYHDLPKTDFNSDHAVNIHRWDFCYHFSVDDVLGHRDCIGKALYGYLTYDDGGGVIDWGNDCSGIDINGKSGEMCGKPVAPCSGWNS